MIVMSTPRRALIAGCLLLALAGPLSALDVEVGTFCRGALIGPKTVVTAWHCIDDLPTDRPVLARRGGLVAALLPASARRAEGCDDVGTVEVYGELGAPERVGFVGSRKSYKVSSALVFGLPIRMVRGMSGSPVRYGGMVIGLLLRVYVADPKTGVAAGLWPCRDALIRSVR